MGLKFLSILASLLLFAFLCSAKKSEPKVTVSEDVPEVTITENRNKEKKSEATNNDNNNDGDEDSEATITEEAEEGPPEDSASEKKVEESEDTKPDDTDGGKEGKLETAEDDKKTGGNSPVVTITDGQLRGKIIYTHSGKPVYAFLGIPFAGPPTGSFRFLPPRPPEPWSGVRDATEEGDHCPQLTSPERKYEGKEDCLYLNVYTKRLPDAQNLETGQQDVIILIHAGGFTHGSGDLSAYGPDYLLDHDVVMVTFNYRLGALGFLTTGDEHAPGNYGLKDQVDAMRWVRRNIHIFSGNPNKVTLLGAQAGGASVHYHLLSALSRNLFHRGISQSGTALSPWAQVNAKTANQRVLKLAELVGCKGEEMKNSERIVRCLRRKPERDLVEMSAKILPYLPDYSFPFVPVDEENVPSRMKSLFQEKPIEMMKKPLSGNWEIPWLVGVTSHEGLPQSLQAMVFTNLMDELNEHPESRVLTYLGLDIQPKEKAEMIAQKIWNFYLKNDTLFYGNLGKLAEMTSDFNYYHGLVKSVNMLVAASDIPIFVYHFSYNRRDLRISLGVPHGEDTLYMFPDIINGDKLTIDKEHFHVIERLLRIVTNFASTGDPTPKESPELDNIQWPDVTSDRFQFVDINHKLTIKKDLHPHRMKFWDTIYKMIDEDTKSTTTTTTKDEL